MAVTTAPKRQERPAAAPLFESPSRTLKVGLFGLMLGFTVSMIGFSDFGELNRMFTLRDFRMFLSFAGGVALAIGGYLAIKAAPSRTKPIHRGTVPGSILFGAGWALSGGCPMIPIVQIGEGYLPAIATIAGISAGMVSFRTVNARWLHLESDNCSV